MHEPSEKELEIAQRVFRTTVAWIARQRSGYELLYVHNGAAGHDGTVKDWAGEYAKSDGMRELCKHVVANVPEATWLMLQETLAYLEAKSGGAGKITRPVGAKEVTFTSEIKPDPGTPWERFELDYRDVIRRRGSAFAFKEYEQEMFAVLEAVKQWDVERPHSKVRLKVPRQPQLDGTMVDGVVIGPLASWAHIFAENDETLELCSRLTRLVPNATVVQLLAALDLVYGQSRRTVALETHKGDN